MTNATATNEITIGTRVRSFDFDSHDLTGDRTCYVQGNVTAIGPKPDTTNPATYYTIQVTCRVFAGKTSDYKAILREFPTATAYAPVNGIPTMMGKTTNGVERIDGDERLPVQQTFDGYSIDELTRAFEAVQDPSDWRNPIHNRVTYRNIDVTAKAIEYFTATRMRISDRSNRDGAVSITARGYRQGPAGDH